MSEEITQRGEFDLPFGRTISTKAVCHEDGLEFLRLTIREGRRFTIIDLDKKAANELSAEFNSWASK